MKQQIHRALLGTFLVALTACATTSDHALSSADILVERWGDGGEADMSASLLASETVTGVAALREVVTAWAKAQPPEWLEVYASPSASSQVARDFIAALEVIPGLQVIRIEESVPLGELDFRVRVMEPYGLMLERHRRGGGA